MRADENRMDPHLSPVGTDPTPARMPHALDDGPLPLSRRDRSTPDGEVCGLHWQAVRRRRWTNWALRRSWPRRWEDAKHLIRENGVTYNVYGDPRGLDRPWELDPIPLLIARPTPRALEAGLVQRARLLDLILADLYGPQRLLA